MSQLQYTRMRYKNMDDLNITLERRREIDAILKETQRKYENGEIKSVPLDVFLERHKRKREELNVLIGRNEEDESKL